MAVINYNLNVKIDEDTLREFIESLESGKRSPSMLASQAASNQFGQIIISTGYKSEMGFDAHQASIWSLGFVRGMEFAKFQAERRK